MPTEKRARQRAGREARKAAQRRAARRRRIARNGAIVVVVAALIVGIVYLTTNHSTPSRTPQDAANATAVAAGCPASPDTRVNHLSWSSPPAMTIDTTRTYLATVKTTLGSFGITLDAKQSPIAVNNFVFLADHGFYRCVIFHRVIPKFVNQTGDPTGKGTGGPGYTFAEPGPPTASPQYPLGSVAMANSNNPATTHPTTNGSQWFVVAGPQGEKLPPDYTLFGHVTSGMSVVDKINADGSATGTPPKVIQRILSVRISS